LALGKSRSAIGRALFFYELSDAYKDSVDSVLSLLRLPQPNNSTKLDSKLDVPVLLKVLRFLETSDSSWIGGHTTCAFRPILSLASPILSLAREVESGGVFGAQVTRFDRLQEERERRFAAVLDLESQKIVRARPTQIDRSDRNADLGHCLDEPEARINHQGRTHDQHGVGLL